MSSSIISLSKQLISIPSTKENPQALDQVLTIAKRELADFTVEEFSKDGVKSLLAYSGKIRPKRFRIILNAHLDVIPGKDNQYKPLEKDEKLYGRGAYDMKAAAAVEILVFKELAKKVSYPLGLQLVTDEEIGGFLGTKHQVEKSVRADFTIAGENTDLDIINRAKGIVWAKITTSGKAAHGAYPWLGDNAIIKMAKIIETIQKNYPEPKKEIWATTINVSVIDSTNKTFNKVPDDCSIMLDIRYIPEDDKTIIPYLKSFTKNGIQVDIVLKEHCYMTDKNNSFVVFLNRSINSVLGKPAAILPHHGGSDIRHYNQVGDKGVEFGPVGQGHHTDNEWVDIKSLEDYYLILKDFLGGPTGN